MTITQLITDYSVNSQDSEYQSYILPVSVSCILELGASISQRMTRLSARRPVPANKWSFYTLYTLLHSLYTFKPSILYSIHCRSSGQNTRTGTHPHFLHWHWHCSLHFCRYWSSYFYCLVETSWQEMWMWTKTVSISWQSWKPSVSSLSSTCWYTPSSLPSLPENDVSDITMIGKLEAEWSDLYFL